MIEQPFAIPSAICFILAIPLVLGLVPRNRYYGVRTFRTLSDDKTWYRTNRLAGVAVMLANTMYGVVATVVPYHRAASDNLGTWGIHLAAFIVPLALGMWVAARSAKGH
jgi:uncharacterized membrane protein